MFYILGLVNMWKCRIIFSYLQCSKFSRYKKKLLLLLQNGWYLSLFFCQRFSDQRNKRKGELDKQANDIRIDQISLSRVTYEFVHKCFVVAFLMQVQTCQAIKTPVSSNPADREVTVVQQQYMSSFLFRLSGYSDYSDCVHNK